MELKHIETKLARASTLPILPNLVMQILALTDDMNAGARDYERLIMQDAALTAKILRTANSSYFGGNGQIANLRRALTQVGNNTLRSMCLTVSLQSALSSKTLNKAFNPKQFWLHSMAVACAAKILACLARDARAEEAFVAGLVHDIGKLALCMFLPLEATHVYQLMQTYKITQFEAELQFLGASHQDIGQIAAQRWQLPDVYLMPIAKHHDPAEGGDEVDMLTAYVHVANCIAHQIGLGFDPAGTNHCPNPAVVALLNISEEQYDPIRSAVAQEVAKMGSQMGF